MDRRSAVITESALVVRARSMVGQGCHYKLGCGGGAGVPAVPWDHNHNCDCSGFVAWCLGVDRHTTHPYYKAMNGGWLETTAIFRDCADAFGMFDGVEWAAARPGMIVVYGDRTDAGGLHHQGHIGIVSAVDETGPTQAIHCSSGNFKATGDAIRETAVLVFASHGARVARCALVTA